jgi:hypothetical protein
MSKITEEQLELLVTKASLDPAFRETLKTAPQEAVKSLVDLDDEDLAVLKILSSDLDRFAKISLEPDDAKSWAVGICHIRSHPPGGRR